MITNHASSQVSTPTSSAALGKVTYSGEPIDTDSKLTARQDLWSYNNQLLFEVSQDSGKSCWFRLPHIAGIPINDLYHHRISDDSSRTSKFELYSPSAIEQRSKVLPVGLHVVRTKLLPEKSLNQKLSSLEQAIVKRQWDHVTQLVHDLERLADHHPRFLFAKGTVAYLQSQLKEAKECFYRAQQLGHPFTTSGLLACHHIERSALTADNTWYDTTQLTNQFETLKQSLPSGQSHILAEILALQAIRDKHFETGLVMSKEGLAINVMSIPLLETYWYCLTQLGLDSEALTLAQFSLAIQPGHGQHYINAFDSSMLLGRLDLAEAYLGALLCQPGLEDPKFERCFILSETTGDWDKLARLSKRLLHARESLKISTQVLLAESLLETRHSPIGLSLLEVILSKHPESIEAILAYGRALGRQGQYEQAYKVASAMLTAHRNSYSCEDQDLLIALVSECLRAMGHPTKALENWEQHSATNVRALLEYAACLAESDEPLKAQQIIERCRQLEPTNPSIAKLEQELQLLFPVQPPSSPQLTLVD